jgi:hypothetical protein
MLNPERTVLVERGDALRRRDKILARRLGRSANEVQDGLLRGAVVPRGEGPSVFGRCPGGCGEKGRKGRKASKRAKHETAVEAV